MGEQVLVLTVPGLNGSGPDHWQSIWERSRADTRRVEQACWHDPAPGAWIARVAAAVRAHLGPVFIAAHSLGCAAVAHWAARDPAAERLSGALLVAPCDVERPGAPTAIARFAPMSRDPLPFRATVAASTNDPYATVARSRCFADDWGASFAIFEGLGHINAASRLGRWEAGEVLLEELVRRAAAGPIPHRRAAALWAARGDDVRRCV